MTLLEDDVADLQDELEEVEIDINLHDERLNIMEDSINNNENDIDGKLRDKLHASINFLLPRVPNSYFQKFCKFNHIPLLSSHL